MNAFDKYVRRRFRARGIGLIQPRLIKTDRAGLAKMYCDLGFRRGAEIGVREGKHSLTLCKNNPDIEFFCIDPWTHTVRWPKEIQERFIGRTKRRLKLYNATIIRKTSMDALADFEDGSLDFVYIDGNHAFDYVAPDIIFWSKKVRQGGVVACHDYFHCSQGGVVDAVNGYTKAHQIKPWYVTYELMPTVFWVNP